MSNYDDAPTPLGPVVLAAGMVCSLPPQQLSPQQSEQLFNFFYDADNALRRRPGSVFFARLGEGQVLGLHEHRFETSDQAPVLAAVAAQGYEEVTTLVDDSFDPAAGVEAVFCPEVRHGGGTIAFSALAEDRFTFASFYDRIYVAGSSVDPYVRFYDYSTASFGKLTTIQARGIIAYRNRLFYYGDPVNPNLLYPSDQEDGESVNENLALDVGSDNAEILRAVEASDGLFLGTTRSAHFYTGFDVEQGDLELFTADPVRGVAGRMAVALGPDGYVYWIDPAAGICRWRRGMEKAEDDFTDVVAPILKRVGNAHLRNAVVFAESTFGGVHFFFPTGSSETPNYVLSFFPALEAWTHGATTTDLSGVGAKASGSDTLVVSVRGVRIPAAGMGTPLYTALLEMRDEASGEVRVIGGDESGYLWIWRDAALKDKARGSVARPGYSFTSFWRSGAWCLSGSASQAMVHHLLFSLVASTDYSLALRVESDFAGLFDFVTSIAADDYPGELGIDWTLGTSVLGRAEPLPDEQRIPLWRVGIGRTVRLELETQSPVALASIDGEYTTTAMR